MPILNWIKHSQSYHGSARRISAHVSLTHYKSESAYTFLHLNDFFLVRPFGQSILPMIEGMFGQSNLRSSTAANGSSAQAQPNAESLAMLQGISSSALSGAPASISQQSVQKVENVTSLDKLITTYPAVAVFFTSATCPPCRVIKPDFEQLIKDKNQDTPSLRILGATVDTSVAFDAGAKYQVRSTPTFMFFHKGQKVRSALTRIPSFTQLGTSFIRCLSLVVPTTPN